MIFRTIEDINNLISKYTKVGGEVVTIEEGVLGLGTLLLCHHDKHFKTFIIKEIFLNEWSSGNTVRGYKKCPQKYIKYAEQL